MRLEPLYRLEFTYPEGWRFWLGDADTLECQWFFFAEGRCLGRLTGRFRGANHPRCRSDGTFEPDLQSVIETDGGADIYFEFGGYGRAYPVGRRQIVGFGQHLCNDDRYQWLNDVVCLFTGEVRSQESGETELVMDIAEPDWEPPAQ